MGQLFGQRFSSEEEEPDTVLGYLFKEALNQISKSKSKISKKETVDDIEYIDEDLTAEKTQTKQGFLDRISGGNSDLMPTNPVFNFISGFSILALIAQSFVTPFGFLSCKSNNCPNWGRKKRQVTDG